MLLEFVIAVAVAFSIGLLIGLTSMYHQVRELQVEATKTEEEADAFYDRVYTDIGWQINLLRCTVDWQEDDISNHQRKRLRRLGSQLLRIKDKDEDHSYSVEGQ